ncbi:MAG TPA: M23 family metallopeptidase [Bacteriovoracaceae bacterium]|nr:M23 family metallopeptidase [Bacteriovoracaceae bacterium]
MKYLLIMMTVVVGSACAQAGPEKVSQVIRPGEVRWLEFPVKGETAKLTCRGEALKFFKVGKKAQAIVMESYFSNLAPFKCVVEADGKVTHDISYKVEDKEYKAEQLRVDPKKIKLSPKDQKKADEEQQILNSIYATSSNELQFTRPFMQPMESVITSVYGIKRVYNKQKKGQHLGIDYRAAIGDKVPAANRGKVRFAGDLFYTGGTVILDHGLDIFTVYGHLSKTTVKAGDIVDRGDLIGLSGNTGRTSGPHLHWGVKIQGQYIDGFALIDETKKYLSE